MSIWAAQRNLEAVACSIRRLVGATSQNILFSTASIDPALSFISLDC